MGRVNHCINFQLLQLIRFWSGSYILVLISTNIWYNFLQIIYSVDPLEYTQIYISGNNCAIFSRMVLSVYLVLTNFGSKLNGPTDSVLSTFLHLFFFFFCFFVNEKNWLENGNLQLKF